MAEAISLAARIVAFITIVGQFSKIVITVTGTFKDAPEELNRLQTHLKDLEFLLSAINQIQYWDSQAVNDPELRRNWNARSQKLQDGFAEFQRLAEQLNCKEVKTRMKWILSHRDRSKKVLSLLSEDVETLKSLYDMMEFRRTRNAVEAISRNQLPAISNNLQKVLCVLRSENKRRLSHTEGSTCTIDQLITQATKQQGRSPN
ncbi:hypothetical protein K440DRAFT_640807 [Wilcoxina mikolae CBS 423.85]|nr:hypothetical protein K440DRAFT_640807 [Wilcoxina mikolae CBS 423.85]